AKMPSTASMPQASFVYRLSADGTKLLYCTYLGGTSSVLVTDLGRGITVDGGGNAYVTGSTKAKDFPVLTPLQATNKGTGSGYLSILNPTGTGLLYSTYIGTTFSGSGTDSATGVALDPQHNIWLTGQVHGNDFPVTPNAFQSALAGSSNAFVMKL